MSNEYETLRPPVFREYIKDGILDVPKMVTENQDFFYRRHANTVMEIEETIERVCKVIEEREMSHKDYAETVKALAMLIEARAHYKQKLC